MFKFSKNNSIQINSNNVKCFTIKKFINMINYNFLKLFFDENKLLSHFIFFSLYYNVFYVIINKLKY